MGTYLHLFDEEQEQTAHINSAQYREPYFAGVNATYKAHYNHYNYKKVNFDTYKPMHYVENTSSQQAYIKTNYYPNNNTRLIIKAQINAHNSYGKWPFLFDAHTKMVSNEFGMLFNKGTTNLHVRFGSTSTSVSNITYGNTYILELSQNGLYVNNEFQRSLTQQTAFTCPVPLLLGCGYNNNSTAIDLNYSTSYKLYWCKIYESDVLVRDYVPVKRISDNKYGVYDQVNNTFTSATNKEYTGA
jgi:hypothetical protein